MGKVELFVGPMFAGKTTALIRRVKELQSQDKKVKVFKHCIDDRYAEESICTHDKSSFNAFNLRSLKEADVSDADVIVVDEFHFFTSELIDYCEQWKSSGKHVIMAGLDLDHLGYPIKFRDSKKDFEDLRKLSDEVTFLKSRCAVCGKEATMTERIAKNDDYFLVGSAESYRPVCKEHHPRWKS
ncbi:thymidine kinase [Candidatus Woesearchaeota archaeon]|nr:thymidine kinase [Candidatus Woesearchaeota archaeon]